MQLVAKCIDIATDAYFFFEKYICFKTNICIYWE